MTDFYAAADGPNRMRGLAMRRENQRLLSDRLNWPSGALGVCWRLEQQHPGWTVSWLNENTIPGFERPAGFMATFEGVHSVEVYAASGEELEALMVVPEHRSYPEVCDFCVKRAWR